jgi:dipeptidyl aminopeptidase/acylaminoacyl peptidase
MLDKKKVEIRDLGEIKAISDPRISPDGKRVVFVHTEMDFEEDTYQNNLWIFNNGKGKPHQFTSSRGKDKSPSWSLNGKYIMFTSTPPPQDGEEKKTQIYIIPADGGEAIQLTDIKEGVESPEWGPNGKKILFISNVKRIDRGDSDVKVIDRLSYKYDGRGFYENVRKHLFTIKSTGGKPTQLTEGEYDVSNPKWTNDGKSIVFSSNLEPDADIVRRSYLYKVDADGGEPEKLTNTLMNISGIATNPKNMEIVYTGHDYRNGSGSNSEVWIYRDGKATPITLDFDQDLGTKLSCDIRVSGSSANPTWADDYIYFTSTYTGVSGLYRVNKDGGDVEKLIGEVDHSVETFNLGNEGKIVYTVLSTTEPIELWLMDKDKTKQLTDLNKDYKKKTQIMPHEKFVFRSNAGHEVEGWLMKPPGFKSSKKYPLILHIHGGPRGAYGHSFLHEFQYLAAQGWAVMYINPWGSGGYYEEYQAALPGNYFEQDYDDLMKAVDVILERKEWVNKNKLGVTGGSYGGVMTNWIITHTDRFAAASTLRSISNWVSFFGVSDIGWTFGKTEIGGTTWEMEEEFMSKSPIRYVANVHTPTQIIHSEEDYRCPMEQAEQLFTALKVLGVDTEFIRFPGENHGLSRGGKPKHREERLQHMVRWFKKYLDW